MKEISWKTGVTIPYTEELDEDGYSYDVFINFDGREGMIFICESGIHFEWERQKSWTVSPIVPKRLFPNQQSLTEEQLKKIIQMLLLNEFDGHTYDESFIEEGYQEWIRQGKP